MVASDCLGRPKDECFFLTARALYGRHLCNSRHVRELDLLKRTTYAAAAAAAGGSSKTA